MERTTLQQLADQGQSPWYDNLSRQLLRSGELARVIELGVLGVTANPTIFEQAVSDGAHYDADIRELALAGRSAEAIYERLIVDDVRSACDLLMETFRRTKGNDGYVSLEVAPNLALDPRGTGEAAQRYWEAVGRPNLMIKIPGTQVGVEAVEEALFRGLNINVTLIFSVERYRQVMEAYCRALERRLEAGLPIDQLRSVASFFVSRVDTEVDQRLNHLAGEVGAVASQDLQEARGTAAIANAAIAYRAFQEVFQGDHFQHLRARGGAVQRPLWASTSTKNPAYRDVLYCEELIAADTVNTMPPACMEAFLDHGRVRESLVEHIGASQGEVEHLRTLGVDLAEVTTLLERQGVAAFAASMEQLLEGIEAKRAAFAGRGLVASPRTQVALTPTVAHTELGVAGEGVRQAGERLAELDAVARLVAKDRTLWGGDDQQQELTSQRLGWLDEPQRQRSSAARLLTFAAWVRDQPFSRAVLVGMGGSMLWPEALRRTFGTRPGFPDLTVLDSSDPDQVAEVARWVDPATTLLLVSSKSGETSETLALCHFFYRIWEEALGEGAGQHCVAITDPDSPLEQLARRWQFQQVFRATPEIDGNFSALSLYGMVPAAAMGIDVEQLLAGAVAMAESCLPPSGAAQRHSPGAELAAILAGSASLGRDKVTLVAGPGLAAMPLWIEQLLASATGKAGVGLVPVVGEPLGDPPEYGPDRVFFYLDVEGRAETTELGSWLTAIAALGHPVVRLPIPHLLDLGAECFRWQVATALVGVLLGVNPFDQPDIQQSQESVDALLAGWARTGRLAEAAGADLQPAVRAGEPDAVARLEDAVASWIQGSEPPGYIGVTAYLPVAVAGSQTDQLVGRLRAILRRASRCAVTFGYGARHLHATGQLHKGGPDRVILLQITGAHLEDPEIPGRSYTFATLQSAQALGDYQVLVGRGRRVLRVHCEDVQMGLEQLVAAAEALLTPVGG